MDILFILASITVVLLLAYILIDGFKRPHKFPPGPQWYPIVGNTPFIRKLTRKFGAMHHTFSYLAKLYDTNILGLKLGTEYFVVVKTEPLLRQMFTRDEFQARPDTFFIRLRAMGTRRGITMVDGPIWKEQRSFALHHLRDLGFGKAVMEDLIVGELQDILKKLSKGGEINWSKFLAPSVLNVLWALAAGTRFEPDDPRLDGLLKLMDERSSAFDMSGGLLNQMPWLRFILPEYSGFNLINRLNAQLFQLLKNTIAEHKKTLNPAKTRDFIDAFLHQMNSDKQTPTKESYFTDDQLIMVCLDFFIAGSQTTSNTLNFAFLTLLHRPDIQQRIHEEIDKFLPNGKMPSLADRSKLPYTEAVLSEFQRFQCVVPVGGPRRVTRTTNLDGYIIPEGTTVLLNVYEHQHNQELWKDPETIRPERFLNDEGKFDPDLIFAFGQGKRRCLGEVLAKNFIFLFFVGILKQFKLSPVAGKELPTLQPNPGITLSPKPYTMVITSRKKEI